MGPGDVHDNRPDEPACGKHGDAHMYDDGHVVECVECLLIEKRERELQISAYEKRIPELCAEYLKKLEESNRLNGELSRMCRTLLGRCANCGGNGRVKILDYEDACGVCTDDRKRLEVLTPSEKRSCTGRHGLRECPYHEQRGEVCLCWEKEANKVKTCPVHG